jgi:hypothetical protein
MRFIVINDQVKEDEICRACSTNGEKMNAYRKATTRERWVDNIKMGLR